MIVDRLALPAPPPAFIEFDARRLLGGCADGRVAGPHGGPRLILTTALAGDVGRHAADADAARRAVASGRWIVTHQVHGARVLPAEEGAGMPADGLVGGAPPEAGGAPPKRDDTEVLAMFAADCALLGVVSPEGVVGVVHCGWRGLLAGIVQAVASEMRTRGASRLAALRSPCICPSCYEFGRSDLEPLAARYGSSVVSTTSSGALSLDLRAGVRRAAEEAEIDRLYEADACTSCEPGWFSYRARGDSARFSLAVAA